jgi:hypothetical protein
MFFCEGPLIISVKPLFIGSIPIAASNQFKRPSQPIDSLRQVVEKDLLNSLTDTKGINIRLGRIGLEHRFP